MNVHFTARHFRARPDVKSHAIDAVEKLGKYYDGILSAEIILSFERTTNSVKTAEIVLHVYGGVLTAKQKSAEYMKSIDAAVAKLEVQLEKYKAKLRGKNKTKVRAIKQKV